MHKNISRTFRTSAKCESLLTCTQQSEVGTIRDAYPALGFWERPTTQRQSSAPTSTLPEMQVTGQLYKRTMHSLVALASDFSRGTECVREALLWSKNLSHLTHA
jgi:hypothetical protein